MEQGTFTPSVFTSTGGMADECKRFHSRLAELLALKKLKEMTTLQPYLGQGRKYPFPSYDQPCCVSEEPGAREEQPVYLTLTLHRKVRKPEFK